MNPRNKAGLFLAVTVTGVGLFLELSAKQIAGVALLGVAFAWLVGSLSMRMLGLAFLLLISVSGLYMAAAPVWGDWLTVRHSASEYDASISDLRLAVIRATQPIDQKAVPIPQGATLGTPGGVTLFDMTKAVPIPLVIEVPKAAEQWVRPVAMADPEGTVRWIPLATVAEAERAGAIVRDDWYARHVDWFVPKNLPAGSFEHGQYKMGNDGSAYSVMNLFFSRDMSGPEIMRAFETEILQPRPPFSLAAALRFHLRSFLVGLALFVSTLCGLMCLLRHARGRSQDSAPEGL